MKIHLSNFAPIIFIEAYLILTLIIFSAGPINYYIESPLLFWGFILSYHLFMVFGYILGTKVNTKMPKKTFLSYQMSIVNIKIIIGLAVIASIMSMKQFTIGQIFNPYFLFESVLQGLINPGEAYTDKMSLVGDSSSNKIFNIFLFLIAFSKIIVIPVIVLNWARLSFTLKCVGLFATLLPVISAISNGTNKSIFDFFIYYFASLSAVFIYNKIKFGSAKFSDYKFFIVLVFISLIGAFVFFGTTIGQRGGSVVYLENISPLGHISLKNYTENSDYFGNIWYVYTWFSNYLVQGYYGFSLSLGQEFDSTFGFGNSVFLMRQFEFLTGIDLSVLTYQHKISPNWNEFAQWHSFYAHFANDFHFAGVAIICFILGFFIARVWIRFLVHSELSSFLLIPILFLLVIFIPANNQIFGLLDTLSAFVILFLIWFIRGRKIRFF